MNDEQIKQYINQQITLQMNQQGPGGSPSMYQSGTPQVDSHTHDGVNSLKVKQSNIIPSISAGGFITFAHIGNYVLNINCNPNPTLLLCYGTVYNSATAVAKAFTFGSAQLGKSYYFQPLTTSSIQVGGLVQPFIQSCSSFTADNSGATQASFLLNPTGSEYAITNTDGIFHSSVGIYSLVDIEYPIGTIHARLTLVSYDGNTVTLNVPYLDAGWQILVNIIII